MAALRSVYSHRLLELLMMFECTGWAKFSLMTFVNQCKQRQLKRKTLRIFAEKIIEPAIKELCEKDGWKIEYETIKAGRKVTGLHFTFERDKQENLF